VSETVEPTNEPTNEPTGPSRNSTRVYVIVAVVLVAIIIVAAALLITQGLPGSGGGQEPTAVAESETTATPVLTFTPVPQGPPTNTPLPAPSPTMAPPAMLDTDTPLFDMVSAGARPSTEWTGFFGQVLDDQQEPLAGTSLIVWYPDPEGIAAEPVDGAGSPVVRTDASGNYEIRLADAPYAGTWSIQVLTDEGQPASKLFTFQTDEDTKAGIQQIQVIWQKLP
jgi:hypothetical protein